MEKKNPELVKEFGALGYKKAIELYPDLSSKGGKAAHLKHPKLGKENARKTRALHPLLLKKAWQKALQTLEDRGWPQARVGGIAAAKSNRKKGFPNIQAQNGRRSAIEKKLSESMKKKRLIFKEQVPIEGICVADMAFPRRKIAVFCDGDYWHNLSHMKERDKRINEKLKASGWRVLRFWEHQINTDPTECVNEILHFF